MLTAVVALLAGGTSAPFALNLWISNADPGGLDFDRGAWEEALAAHGLTGKEIDWLVPHQANQRIIDGMAKKLGLPNERVVSTVARHANTSAASVPLALDVAVRSGRIARGDTVMLEGVGGGFTWGAVLVDF